jgi:nucleoside-diphosphate-sugar epimerase
MILLRLPADAGHEFVAVFGVGLIGSSLVASLEREGAHREAHFPVAWNEPIERARQMSAIATMIERGRNADDCRGLHVVWSAGRCGFEASQAEADLERDAFDEWLTALDRVVRQTQAGCIRFTLISTAGGLFEGQRHVDSHSRPNPKRPYGRLKFYQEQRIQAEGVPWTSSIVRLTSVVGPIGDGRRQGLVSTLVANGLRRLPTRIVGRMETLRDFISVADVAAFLAHRIRQPETSRDSRILTLASYKPSSLAEVQRVVERILGRRLYVNYALAPSNEMDITFSPNLRPPGWAPRDLFSSVRELYQDALTRGAVG